jgi:esterase/lipase superfamily enzyme
MNARSCTWRRFISAAVLIFVVQSAFGQTEPVESAASNSSAPSPNEPKPDEPKPDETTPNTPTPIAQSQDQQSELASEKAKEEISRAGEIRDNLWAKLFLENDPLSAKETITLEDLRKGIEDSRQHATVITRHFPRVTAATDDEKRGFLVEAMQSPHPIVQRQAASELFAMNALESVVRDFLLDYLESEDPQLRSAAVVGLELIEVPAEHQSEQYWAVLIESIGDPDPMIVQAAARQLKDLGANAIPSLLSALREKHPRSLTIARILSEIVGSKTPFHDGTIAFAAPEPTDAWPTPESEQPTPPPTRRTRVPLTVGKSAPPQPPTNTLREVDPTQPTSVTVYFGTNRELVETPQQPRGNLFQYPLLALLLLAALVALFTGSTTKMAPTGGEIKPRGCSRWLLPLILLGGVFWSMLMFRNELQQHWQIRSGISFGPRRDPLEAVHYGTCKVSIPPRHQVGVVERPVIGPEREQDHVVLKQIDTLEEDAFFEAVKLKVAELPVDSRSCFVFIHGFNVDFDSAARRTAQMHYDLKFDCVPIFFSWPSRANIRHYFSDRNEIEFSRYVIKQFLSDIADRVKADRIHVIAHSMGADATCRAIADLGDRGQIFDQIILAAPDIDSEVFRVQIAPRLTKTANRTTMYCSQKDWALVLSRNFNDSRRAGDSSGGVLVLEGVDTIDASDIDTDLLGHSYYGDCLPILADVNLMMRSALPPLERRLRPWPVDQQLLYWTLPDAR